MFSKLFARVMDALTTIAADANLRSIVGGLISGALGHFGLHASAETVVGIMLVGVSLARMGPHVPANA